MAKKPNISVSFSDKDLENIVQELQVELQLEIKEDGVLIERGIHDEQSILIDEIANGYRITAQDLPHFLQGVASVVMALQDNKVPPSKLTYSFQKNGLMLDSSRNAVANLATLKQLIRKMAIMGHTWMMLYIEDVYEIESEPYFGALRGRYSQDELKEIDQYGHQFGIEVFPAIQTLAHINQFFYWEHEARKYADIDDILNVKRPETLTLIDKMLATMSQCFKSRKIHIGMDEAYNLGRGTYLTENSLQSKTEIMHEHLENLIPMCQKYNLEPMIWDDMFFSNYSKIEEDDDYQIPEEIELMYWDYYRTSKDDYLNRIDQRAERARNLSFAGGIWKWTGYAPHPLKTLLTTKAALAACKEKQINKVIATAWGDDGAEAPIQVIEFGLVLYSYLDSEDEYDEGEFNRLLEYYTGIDFITWMKQGEFDLLPEFDQQKGLDVNPAKYFLYQDLLLPLFHHYIDAIGIDYGKKMEELVKYFQSHSKKENDLHDFYAKYASLLQVKWNLPLRIWKAYHENDKESLYHITTKDLPILVDRMEDFLEARRSIWLQEANPEGLEVLEYKLGGLITRSKTTQKRLNAYLLGEVDRLAELEAERVDASAVSWPGIPQALHYNRSLRMMTRSRMFY